MSVNHKIYATVIFVAAALIGVYVGFMITPAQIRAARALLGWKQTDLAERAGLSEMSIKNIERKDTDSRMSTINAIRLAFEREGIQFVGPGIDPVGPGVARRP